MNVPAPEFSRLVAIETVGIPQLLVASQAEREALAKRFDILSIEKLEANLMLAKARAGQAVRICGQFRAKVTQECVVTLEPIEAQISEEIETLMMQGIEADEGDDLNGPEPLEGSEIDLGELVAQHLALALDPYPRKAGAEFPGYSTD